MMLLIVFIPSGQVIPISIILGQNNANLKDIFTHQFGHVTEKLMSNAFVAMELSQLTQFIQKVFRFGHGGHYFTMRGVYLVSSS